MSKSGLFKSMLSLSSTRSGFFPKIDVFPQLQHIQTRFYSPEPVKRFYAKVDIVQLQAPSKDHTGRWGINLDKRQLKTPNKRLFEVDNESIAHVVANEWAVQKKIVMLNTMHMTALANTVIDNPFHKTTFSICNEILNWLPMDTILYRTEENERLWELQRELWDPCLQWFQTQYDIKLPIVAGAITPPDIPEQTLAVLRNQLMSYRFDALLGLQFAAEALKSLILTMGVAKLHLTTSQALHLNRLELDFQIKHWGNIEWSHDIENYDTMSRFACGMMFFSLNTYPPFRYVEKVDAESLLAYEKTVNNRKGTR